MGKFVDLTGQRYGNLIVIKRDATKTGKVYWECLCDCGNHKSINSSNIRNGHTRSCGCLREKTEARHFLHRNQTKIDNPRLYSVWKSMKSRCYNEKNTAYRNYGARGIRMCDEWLGDNGLSAFVNWAKDNGYNEVLTIDRINTDGDYSPQNCRWITCRENQNNKRNNRYIEHNGRVRTLAQWANEYSINPCVLKRRLDTLHLPIDVALTMQGIPRIYYKERRTSISHLAKKYHISYVLFLHEALVCGKSAESIVDEYSAPDEATRQKMQRLIQDMEQR